jgi:hypothetical protein
MSVTTKEILLKLKTITDISDVSGNVDQIQKVFSKLNLSKELN